MKPQILYAPPGPPQALERWLAEAFEKSHLEIRSWIQQGCIHVNGCLPRPRQYLTAGQAVEVYKPALRPHPALPEALALEVIDTDADIIVVNKPAGMASHPGPGWWQGSCVNALLHHIQDWPGIKGVAGPGIVHRLDRETSGLMVFAKSEKAHLDLLTQMRQRQITRQYLAWVEGIFEHKSGSIDAPLGRSDLDPHKMSVRADGQSALTHYRVIGEHRQQTLLQLKLETGRTHQIRVHLAHIGHPICGDERYGDVQNGLALHAYSLAFLHPRTQEARAWQLAPPWEGRYVLPPWPLV